LAARASFGPRELVLKCSRLSEWPEASDTRAAYYSKNSRKANPMNGISTRMVVTILGKGASAGKDRVGAIVRIASILANANANIVEITQTNLREFFSVMVLVDLKSAKSLFGELRMRLYDAGQELGIRVDAVCEERLPSRVEQHYRSREPAQGRA